MEGMDISAEKINVLDRISEENSQESTKSLDNLGNYKNTENIVQNLPENAKKSQVESLNRALLCQ